MKFRNADFGEGFADYMEKMWFFYIENNRKKLIGKHNNIKIKLTEEDE